MAKLYLCNGNKNDCTKEYCWKNGGECRHTTDKKNRLFAQRAVEVKIGKDTWEMQQKEVEKMIERSMIVSAEKKG